MIFERCTLRNHELAPARFAGPLAGLTHSAFRRLLADFGGYGAVWTEMLAAPQILKEDVRASPWLRRRPEEGTVVYQLMVRQGDPLESVLGRLRDHGAEAVDLNMACDALSVRACEAGSALFENLEALRWVAGETRRHWSGLLTAKIRLGSRRPDWRPRLVERLRALEESGVDAIVVHPRFFEDKFRRRARLDLLPWIASLTRMPIIANGDLTGPAKVAAWQDALAPVAGLMIGRMAVACPWVFAAWEGPVTVDPGEVWRRLYDYVLEDCGPENAVRRIKLFTKYYSANFAFGHQFRVDVTNAHSIEDLRERADRFFATAPALVPDPNLAGL